MAGWFATIPAYTEARYRWKSSVNVDVRGDIAKTMNVKVLTLLEWAIWKALILGCPIVHYHQAQR